MLQPVLLGMGANLTSAAGPPAATISQAIEQLKNRGMGVQAVSRFYRTPAFPAGTGPDYVNAVVFCKCDKSPDEVLAALHSIENQFGRRRNQRWGARSLDIDLLSFGDLVLPDLDTYQTWRDLSHELQPQQTPDVLILPHPRLHERAFVLVPLAEVMAGWKHPVSGTSAAQMLMDLPKADIAGIRAI